MQINTVRMKLKLPHLIILVMIAVMWSFPAESVVYDDLAGFIDSSDSTNGGFLKKVEREPVTVSTASSGESIINGEFRSVCESRGIPLRSDSFRALTITIR